MLGENPQAEVTTRVLVFEVSFCLSLSVKCEIQVKQAMAQSVDGTLAEKKRMLRTVFYVFEWSSIDV